MSDPIDALEQQIERAVESHGALDLLAQLYGIIDAWRVEHGGCERYLARTSRTRRNRKILDLAAQGLSAREIAERVGTCARHVRRVKSRQSSYL